MRLPENIGYRGHLPTLNSIAVRGAIATAIVCLLPWLLTYGTRQSTKANVSVVLKDQSKNYSRDNHQKDQERLIKETRQTQQPSERISETFSRLEPQRVTTINNQKEPEQEVPQTNHTSEEIARREMISKYLKADEQSKYMKDSGENGKSLNSRRERNICVAYHMHKEEYKRKGYSYWRCVKL
jgi:hypothetical protein